MTVNFKEIPFQPKTPRPEMASAEIDIAWAEEILKLFKIKNNEYGAEDKIRSFLLAYANEKNTENEMPMIDFIFYMNHPNMYFEEYEHLTNDDVLTILNSLNSMRKAVLEEAVRGWVIQEGIRFPAKEGDAVELIDPETKFEKIGTVLAVYAPKASALVQYRDKREKTIITEIPAERIMKVYRDGKPIQDPPRGGKVRQEDYPTLQAKAA